MGVTISVIIATKSNINVIFVVGNVFVLRPFLPVVDIVSEDAIDVKRERRRRKGDDEYPVERHVASTRAASIIVIA